MPFVDADDIGPHFEPPGADLPLTKLFVDQPWAGHGRCRGMDPDFFFPEHGDTAQAAEAKKVCKQCVVRLDCLEWAIATKEQLGIFGGMSPRARRSYAAERRRQGNRFE